MRATTTTILERTVTNGRDRTAAAAAAVARITVMQAAYGTGP